MFLSGLDAAKNGQHHKKKKLKITLKLFSWKDIYIGIFVEHWRYGAKKIWITIIPCFPLVVDWVKNPK